MPPWFFRKSCPSFSSCLFVSNDSMLCAPSNLQTQTARNVFPLRCVSIVLCLFCLVLNLLFPFYFDMVQLFGGALFSRTSKLFWAYWYNFSVSKMKTALCREKYFLWAVSQWRFITPDKNHIVGWMDYLESTLIIDTQEQQSNYYEWSVVICACDITKCFKLNTT